ncbi:hypothetical protein Unana1_07235 [Umbelopsis nana]
MASESDEEDYMSAKFLDEPEELKNKELSYAEKRKKTLREQQKKAYIKPRKVLEEEARQQGLQKGLDEKNKGMKMLMKMGFKQGMTLGKESGIAKPIEVEMKAGRGGIGLDSQEKRLREEELEQELAKRPKIDPVQFRDQLSAQKREAKLHRWAAAAGKLCEKLDKDQDIEFNVLWLLNPDNVPNEENELGAQDVDGPVPLLEEGLAKEKPMEQPEPEKTATDTHLHQPLQLNDEQLAQYAELQSHSVADQLNRAITYLRTNYCYCFWCGVKYEDEEDLKNCPGPTEEDH